MVVDPAAGAGRRAFRNVSGDTHSASPAAAMMSSCVTRASRRRFGIDLHVHLPQALAPDRDVGHAGHAEQPRLDGPARQQRQFGRVDLVGRDADHHEAAGGRQRLQDHRRLRHVGQRVRQRQALLHHLARLHDVGAALEGQHDRRQAGHRLRADRIEPRHAAQQFFEVEGDQAFALLRPTARRFGLHFDHRRRELGEDVDRHRCSAGRCRTATSAAAPPSTRKRNCRLAPMIQRNMAALPIS